MNDGGPAFPTRRERTCEGYIDKWENDGMSLLDYFAGKALIAIMSARAFDTSSTKGEVTNEAYSLAKCMLESRRRCLTGDKADA